MKAVKKAVGKVAAHEFFVSPEGDDSWSGLAPERSSDASDGPFRTIEAAQAAARRLIAKGLKRPVKVSLRGGTYFLKDTLTFLPEDSGTERFPMVYAAYPGEAPVISGGRRISEWRKDVVNGRPCWVAELPDVVSGGWSFTQLFVDGARRGRARLPKTGFYKFTGRAGYEFSGKWGKGLDGAEFAPGEIRRWKNLDDVKLLVYQLWFESHLRIKEVDEEKRVVQFRSPSLGSLADDKEGLARYRVENVFEALSDPGEWYLDKAAGRLYYLPMPGESMEGAEVIAPRLDKLVRFSGVEGAPVRHIRLENLAFAHSEWDYPPDDSGSIQAGFKIPGAVVLDRAEDCVLYGCEVSHVAQYAVQVMRGSVRNKIVACVLRDLGAGGVRVEHEWLKPHGGEVGGALETGDSAPPSETTISDCVIHDCGSIFPSSVCVWIGNTGKNRILHNHIFNTSYTGISCGWTWGYAPTATVDNRIEFNHIHHVNWDGLLSDNGGIYTLGTHPGGVVRGNLIHHVGFYGYGGWGIYPDEGSSEMLFEDNVVHHTGKAGFSTHYSRDNVVRNNIFALAGEGFFCPGRSEKHRSTVFERNIVVWEKRSPCAARDWSSGNYLIIDNLLWDGDGCLEFGGGMTLRDWQEYGQFAGTLVADPLFADPDAGDFTLRSDSPAVGLGFKLIDTKRVGPRLAGGRPASFADLEMEPIEPRPIVRTFFEFTGEGVVKLTVTNVGDVPASGRIEPRGGAMDGGVRLKKAKPLSFKSLKPGASLSAEFLYQLEGKPSRAWIETKVEGAGVIPAAAFIKVETGVGAQEWRIPRLDSVPALEGLASALSGQESRRVSWFKMSAGELRVGVANGHFLLHAHIQAASVSRGNRIYEGTCVEVFSSSFKDKLPNPDANNTKVIRQVFLAPPAEGHPSRAAFVNDGGVIEDTAVVRMHCVEFQGGFDLCAAIPLSLMRVGLDDEGFLLEVVVTTSIGATVRASAFGSRSAHSNNVMFCAVRW